MPVVLSAFQTAECKMSISFRLVFLRYNGVFPRDKTMTFWVSEKQLLPRRQNFAVAQGTEAGRRNISRHVPSPGLHTQFMWYCEWSKSRDRNSRPVTITFRCSNASESEDGTNRQAAPRAFWIRNAGEANVLPIFSLCRLPTNQERDTYPPPPERMFDHTCAKKEINFPAVGVTEWNISIFLSALQCIDNISTAAIHL
jgi:hypothetical protein